MIDAAAGFETAKVYDPSALPSGRIVDGPAIIDQPDTMILVPRGWRCRAGAAGCLLIERR